MCHSRAGAGSVGHAFAFLILILRNVAIVSGQGLTRSELVEPLGPQQRQNIANMFNTNPNRLYDDFDGNTIYHKFHPIDDYVPPLPLTSPNLTTEASNTSTASSDMNYRPSLSGEPEGFDSNALLRIPPGPIGYHYSILPPKQKRRRRPRKPTSSPPVANSRSTSKEPKNDIVKRQAAVSAPAPSTSSATQSFNPRQQPPAAAVPQVSEAAQASPRYEIYRPQPKGGQRLPSFQLLQPGSAASFVPLRVTPTTNSGSGPGITTYGIYANTPALFTDYNAPLFRPVPGLQNAAQRWVPQHRPVYFPEPNVAPAPVPVPVQVPQFPNNVQLIRPIPVPGVNRNFVAQAPRNPAAAFEPRPQLIDRQLRFPTPVPLDYNIDLSVQRSPPFLPGPLPPPPAYPGPGAGRYSRYAPRPDMMMMSPPPYGPPPPGFGQFRSLNSPNPMVSPGPLLSPPPPGYGRSPLPNPAVSQAPRNSWNGGTVDMRLMPPPPNYVQSTPAVRSFPPQQYPSYGPYNNQSPRMGMPPQNPGQFIGFGGGRQPQQQPPPYPSFGNARAQQQQPNWQGSGFASPSFDAGQRSSPAQFQIPQQRQQGTGALYTPPAPARPTGFFGGNGQSTGFQQPINAGQFGGNAGQARPAPWTGPTAIGTNQPNQVTSIRQPEVQPISISNPGNDAASNTAAATRPAAAAPTGFTGSSFRNSGSGGSNPIGLSAQQEPVQPQRSSASTQGAQVPDLSANRGPVPFYSQADVDNHYRRMLAHNETAADSEFENDPRILQWYLQRAQQILQERGRQAQTSGGTGGSSRNTNNPQSNAQQPGNEQLSVPTGAAQQQQPTAAQTSAFPNQQPSSGGGNFPG